MSKAVVVGGLVAVVVIVGLVMLVNRMNAPTVAPGEDQKDLTADEYSTPPVVVSPTASGSPAAASVAAKEFAIAASEFKFTPAEIRVKKGDTVKITLTNSGAMLHDWRVDEFDATTKTITKGQTDTVEFVADQVGTFEYYCSVGNHRQQGMVGKLIVE
jgi:Plastocyanin